MHLENITVTKANGEKDLFSVEKLKSSMSKSGASPEQIDSIIKDISPKLYDGISTRKIYRWAFNKLKQRSKNIAARYQLKKAIMDLGPDGFIFEQFVAEIFRKKNYKTKVGEILAGKCIPHEIDVLAVSDNEVIMVECKYHSVAGKISDVKTPLYIQSRFKDLEENWKGQHSFMNKKHSAWVVTNTRFSPDAERYGMCVGLNLLGWDYPIRAGIKELIDEHRLYPITCLTSLTRSEKDQLLQRKVIFCHNLIQDTTLLTQINISDKRISSIMEELGLIVNV